MGSEPVRPVLRAWERERAWDQVMARGLREVGHRLRQLRKVEEGRMAELKVWFVRERERRSGGVRNWNIICHMSMGSEDDILNARMGWGGGGEKQKRSEVEVEEGVTA